MGPALPCQPQSRIPLPRQDGFIREQTVAHTGKRKQISFLNIPAPKLYFVSTKHFCKHFIQPFFCSSHHLHLESFVPAAPFFLLSLCMPIPPMVHISPQTYNPQCFCIVVCNHCQKIKANKLKLAQNQVVMQPYFKGEHFLIHYKLKTLYLKLNKRLKQIHEILPMKTLYNMSYFRN